MTYEAAPVDAALLRRINEDLRIALREAGAILAKQGRSPAEAWEATQPFLPLMVLLRSLTDAPQGALPSAENIESAYVERQPLRVCKVLPLKAAGAASPNGPQEKP